MKILFELLFNAWVPSPDPSQWPEAITDPVKGYGQFAFSEGLKLGILLGAASFGDYTA